MSFQSSHRLRQWYAAAFGTSEARFVRCAYIECRKRKCIVVVALTSSRQRTAFCVLRSFSWQPPNMSPGTGTSPKSPKGFFRLEPMQSHSASGEACFSLNHVADKDPFVAQSKRPWVSRRKSRKAEPPWKKFVTVFRVAPQDPVAIENASSIEPESPAVRFGNFEMENQSVASMGSSSFVDFTAVTAG